MFIGVYGRDDDAVILCPLHDGEYDTGIDGKQLRLCRHVGRTEEDRTPPIIRRSVRRSPDLMRWAGRRQGPVQVGVMAERRGPERRSHAPREPVCERIQQERRFTTCLLQPAVAARPIPAGFTRGEALAQARPAAHADSSDPKDELIKAWCAKNCC